MIPFDKLLSGKHFELNHHRYDAFTGTEESEKFILENLSFPHANLKLVLDSFEEYSGKPVTKEAQKLYQKNQAMFEKIKFNESDTKKWFDSLGETLNDRFIIQNVEARIAEEPKNMELWKLFISFLKKKNKWAAYEVYCRYSRLFHGEKTFAKDFEIWKGNPTKNQYLEQMKFCKITSIHDYHPKFLPPSPLYFQCHSLPPQNFVFPVSMINLMIQNSNGKILQKLYQTSKYFFFKTQKPLCHTFHLKIFRKSNFFENSLSLNEESLDFEGLKKISIYHQLIVNHHAPTIHFTRKILSTVLPKLNIENLFILKIKSQIISPKEYHRLTENGIIEKIILMDVKVKYEDGTLVTLEELFKNLSKASYIDLLVMATATSDCWQFLENFQKFSKIHVLIFPCCISNNQSTSILKFLFNNVHADGKVKLQFRSNGLQTEYENIRKMNPDYPKFKLN